MITGRILLNPPNETPFTFTFGRRTSLALDLGGVLEFYPSKRTVLRFDAGDTVIRYRPPGTKLGLQLSTGFTFKF